MKSNWVNEFTAHKCGNKIQASVSLDQVALCIPRLQDKYSGLRTVSTVLQAIDGVHAAA